MELKNSFSQQVAKVMAFYFALFGIFAPLIATVLLIMRIFQNGESQQIIVFFVLAGIYLGGLKLRQSLKIRA